MAKEFKKDGWNEAGDSGSSNQTHTPSKERFIYYALVVLAVVGALAIIFML